jgi:hypothetical protein
VTAAGVARKAGGVVEAANEGLKSVLYDSDEGSAAVSDPTAGIKPIGCSSDRLFDVTANHVNLTGSGRNDDVRVTAKALRGLASNFFQFLLGIGKG